MFYQQSTKVVLSKIHVHSNTLTSKRTYFEKLYDYKHSLLFFNRNTLLFLLKTR